MTENAPPDRSAPMLHRVARNVSEMRRDQGWAQSDLAREAGMSRNVVNALEQETTFPGEPDLARIAEALQTSVAVLRGIEFRANTHHIVQDRQSQAMTVAYYDGTAWYVPGSATAFATGDFGQTGSRFEILDPVAMPVRIRTPWKVEDGRHA